MNIIFHHPLPLNYNATSASGIRPLRMLAAFENLGYTVDLVTGYSKERNEKIKTIKKNINNGIVYDFVYSESSTMPTVLTDKHHLPLNPLLDFNFFKFCKKNNIKIGLFYRDIYWAFDGYGKELNPLKVMIAKAAYKYDLINYDKYLTKLYLPSIEMGEYVPIVTKDKFTALPPGHEIEPFSSESKLIFDGKRKLKIFYVGGISEHYQMHTLFTVINKRDDVEFILCTRETEWLSVQAEYPALSKNIKVVHESGKKMKALMLDSDVVSIFVKPQEYREFAAPVKLYEYLGERKPIIASEGTLAGKFVSENKIGWNLPYEENSLNDLLNKIIKSPQKLTSVQQEMNAVAIDNTWLARAKQVIKDLKK